MIMTIGLALQLALPCDSTLWQHEARGHNPADTALARAVIRCATAEIQYRGDLPRVGAPFQTEIAVLGRARDGAEATTSVEQLSGVLRWRPDGSSVAQIDAMRSDAQGFGLTEWSSLRRSWIIPTIDGGRIALPFPDDAWRLRTSAPVWGVLPLASESDSVYAFSFAEPETASVTEIVRPTIRINVRPVAALPSLSREFLFSGEIALDAATFRVVRLRGRFQQLAEAGSEPGADPARAAATRIQRGARAVLYVDLVNAVVNGAWAPIRQRLERQVPDSGRSRAVLRIVTIFDHGAEEPEPHARTAEGHNLRTRDLSRIANDTIRARPPRIMVPTLSLASLRHPGFTLWRVPLGEMTARARVRDFDDVAPGDWGPGGGTRVLATPFARASRVEGLVVGGRGEVQWRDRAPGVILYTRLERATAAQTARGGADVEVTRGPWVSRIGAGRTLDVTNDFQSPFDNGPGLEALLGQDRYDYVDRRTVTLSLARSWGVEGVLRSHLDAGLGEDAQVPLVLVHPLIGRTSTFEPNRGVLAGRYVRTALSFDLRPDVNAAFARPGTGVGLRYERGDGELQWQRIDARVAARRTTGALILTAQLEGGVVTGRNIPPQQLFELGETEGLTGFTYKQFGGTRAAIGRSSALYALPALSAPLHILGRLYVPAPAPALAVGFAAGWADAPGEAGAQSLARLGTRLLPNGDQGPASVPTGRARMTADLSLRLFGGVELGVAHALEHGTPWRLLVNVSRGK